MSNELTYFYVVSAVNTTGEGADSTAVGVTPHGPPLIGAALMVSGSQLSLTMPGWASNYAVYAATNLASPNWRPVTNAPQSSNGVLYLNVPATNQVQEFFRLSYPGNSS